jgi:FMN phosphatase YigB (HAD superfamily)
VTKENANSGFQQILFDTPPKKRRTLDRYFKRVYGLTPEQRKPSPAAYQVVLNGSGPERRNAYVIGDSLQNDLAPAHLLGAKTVWAKYGTKVQKENLETVLGITPWTPQQIALAYDNAFAPDFVAGNIFEAAEIIDCELTLSGRIRQKNP